MGKMKNGMILVVAVLALTGCSTQVPKCSDSDVTNLVTVIADREMADQASAEVASMFSYAVNSIRTTSTDAETGARECAAELEIIPKGQASGEIIPIVYTVEVTDDGEDIYVNVFGL